MCTGACASIIIVYLYFALVISPFEIIQYYYQYLLENMDSDSISHVMACRKMLTDGDMEVINKCSGNSQRNVLVLNHVLHMSISKLFAFLDVVQELEHQHYITTILTSGKYYGRVCNPMYITGVDLEVVG